MGPSAREGIKRRTAKMKSVFYNRKKRHVRGHRTLNGVHPSLIVGHNDKSLFYMGMDTTKPSAKHIKLKQKAIDKKTGVSKDKYLRLRIEDDKRSKFSKNIYLGHKFTASENKIIDRQINKKRNFCEKK